MGRKFERVSIAAGQNDREILSPLQFTGVMNASLQEETTEYIRTCSHK